MGDNESKEFILEFFKNSDIADKDGVLAISKVPKEFETFIGKNAPYKLVFDVKMHNKIKDSELITQGSYFLIAMRNYLSDKGQTSLLKINIAPDLSKINLILPKNSKIISIKPADFEFISRFHFLSIYQYLNEKKQSINNIIVRDNKILDISLKGLKTVKGNQEEISQIDLTKFYELAKNQLKRQVAGEIKPIKYYLKERLDKELFRVKDHYLKKIKEKDEELESCERKIKLLQSKLKHTYYDRDISILQMQIRESKERLENLKKKVYKERLKAEETFHITDEVEKHALSIKNSLINITLFYYPIYNILVSGKGKDYSMKYDPILDTIS